MKFLIVSILTMLTLCINAQTKDEIYKRALAYQNKEDYAHAMSTIDSALRLDIKNPGYLSVKASSLRSLKKFQEAYQVYSKMIELYPENVLALNDRALILQASQEYDAALKDFDLALSLKNTDTVRMMLLTNRGTVKANIRDFNGAYDDLFAAYKIDSTQIGVLVNLAAVCDEVGKGDLTIKYLEDILDMDSTFIGAYGNLGFKYQNSGEYKKAISYFNKVLSLDPKEPLSYNNRGFCRFKLGDLTAALSDINKAIEIYPYNSFAFKNRALVFIAQKKRQAACDDIEMAIKLGFTTQYGSEVEDLKTKNCLDNL